MGARETIKAILATENIKLTQIAEKLGTSVQNLSNKLRNKNIKYSEIEAIAEILNYEIKFEKRK